MRYVWGFLCVFAWAWFRWLGVVRTSVHRGRIELTIVSDNVAFDDRLETAWGYACVVRGLSRPILFDTGPDGTKLLANMEKLSLDAGALDLVFLSHSHADHIGGVVPFLRAAPPSDVYLLESFPPAFKDAFAAEGATVHEVTERERIIEQAHSLGPLGTEIPEQALVIDGADGLIVVTGCAHPGIANIVATAREAFGKEVLLVMGGFHLFESTSQQIEEAVEALQQLGVQYVAPSHCTGDPAREAFARAFGSRLTSRWVSDRPSRWPTSRLDGPVLPALQLTDACLVTPPAHPTRSATALTEWSSVLPRPALRSALDGAARREEEGAFGLAAVRVLGGVRAFDPGTM